MNKSMKLICLMVLASLTACATTAKIPPQEKLETAYGDYLDASRANEVDRIGSTGTAIVEREKELNQGFHEILTGLESNKGPSFTEAQLKQKEADLKTTFQKLLKEHPDNSSDVTVMAAGLNLTQETWNKYRQAWLEYAQAKYPAQNRAQLSAWLAEQRVREMKSIASDEPK